MGFYIDSADLQEVRAASKLGWIAGVTTNPTLMAIEDGDVGAKLVALREVGLKQVFYQLTATNIDGLCAEAELANEILGDQLVVKIPPTPAGWAVAGKLSEHLCCCMTALFSLTQISIAQEIGVAFVAVYVHRITLAGRSSTTFLRRASALLAGSQTSLIGASFRSVAEVDVALAAGATHITAPWQVLRRLGQHADSEVAVSSFAENGRGLAIFLDKDD